MEKKNVAMSVRAKLLNIRNSEPGTEYMQVLLRICTFNRKTKAMNIGTTLSALKYVLKKR